MPHGSRRAASRQASARRAQTKQNVVDLSTSIVKARIPHLEPLVAPLDVLLDRQSGDRKLRWRVIGSLRFRVVHGC